ncbi:MAG: serine/threonine protein kinase [Deltaproteobacteria bacterium]|nr:serine/threonine protein kinase [Deltaproteobacteria bacterium]
MPEADLAGAAAAEPASALPAPLNGVVRDADGVPLPQRFGPYVLYDLIGRGGMAEIFLGRTFTALGQPRTVAVKRMLAHLSSDERFGRMLVAEAKLCATLRHANIVQVVGLGRTDGRLHIDMEYVEGLDLHDLLRRCTRRKIPFPTEFAFLILEEASRALAHAHRARDENGRPLGIVHRDLSPTNVLVSFEGEVKLCDFGIARAAADGVRADEVARDAGMLRGKFAYMSPEQARAEEVDARADIFAFGILVWELLAGRRLYKGGNDMDTLRLAQQAEIPPLPRRGRPWEDTAQTLLDRALAFEPARRFQTSEELHDGIRDIILGHDIIVSPVRFAEFLREHFGGETLAVRRERERGVDLIAPPRLGAGRGGDGPPGGIDRRKSQDRAE